MLIPASRFKAGYAGNRKGKLRSISTPSLSIVYCDVQHSERPLHIWKQVKKMTYFMSIDYKTSSNWSLKDNKERRKRTKVHYRGCAMLVKYVK